MHAWVVTYVPLALTPCMRSNARGATDMVPPLLMAEALLMHTSMPPKCSAAIATALCTALSSRMSRTMGSAWPPASSTSSAAE